MASTAFPAPRHALGLRRHKPQFAEVAAFRNGTLQNGYFIIAAPALGLDTGPMCGFDNAAVDREFFPGGKVKSNFICAVGSRMATLRLDAALQTEARELLRAVHFVPLVVYEQLGRDALLSVPTPDHSLPLIYVLAQHREGDRMSFPTDGFDGGSISMLTVRIG